MRTFLRLSILLCFVSGISARAADQPNASSRKRTYSAWSKIIELSEEEKKRCEDVRHTLLQQRNYLITKTTLTCSKSESTKVNKKVAENKTLLNQVTLQILANDMALRLADVDIGQADYVKTVENDLATLFQENYTVQEEYIKSDTEQVQDNPVAKKQKRS